MRLIAITTETIFPKEAFALNRLFKEGMPLLHLRKPRAVEEDIRHLLLQIEDEYYDRIVLHDHFALTQIFPLKGVHLSRRNIECPYSNLSSISCSCHSLQCIEASLEKHSYIFLSPIFDSISKQGYKQAFTHEQLLDAKKKGIINDKVIALGGINEDTIPLAKQYAFGGVAVLGALWGNYLEDRNERALITRLNNLLSITKTI
jgi:thiamine-phosphate pyrophosphorylase